MLPAIALFILSASQATTPAAPPIDAQAPATTQSAPTKPPCVNPDAAGKYHIGCGVTVPVLIYKTDPEIPRIPKGMKLITTVLVSLTVNANGKPIDIRLKRPDLDSVDKASRALQEQFEENVIKAVQQYKFKPATYQGKPVPIELNLETNINLF